MKVAVCLDQFENLPLQSRYPEENVFFSEKEVDE